MLAQEGNGPKDKNGYYLCGTCGKTHKGVCCKLNTTQQPSKQGGDTLQKWMSKYATKNYIK